MGLINSRLEGLDSLLQRGDSPRKIILPDRRDVGRGLSFLVELDIDIFADKCTVGERTILPQSEEAAQCVPDCVLWVNDHLFVQGESEGD